jgi:hypothetical protein
MKNAYVLGLFVLVSCAHTSQEKVVSFPFEAELLEGIQKQVSRAPAKIEMLTEIDKSPRRVYFTALYHQYLSLSKQTNQSSAIEMCPQFHHDKIETDSSMIPELTVYKAPYVEDEGKKFFPELAFGRKFSLKDYRGSIENELQVLCEEGESDNYYKFDNLVTHYAGKKSFHSNPDAMKSILKIPVFANYYLLKMLQSPISKVETHPEEKRVIALTQTHWFEKYVTEAQRMRKGFIKNQMVRR